MNGIEGIEWIVIVLTGGVGPCWHLPKMHWPLKPEIMAQNSIKLLNSSIHASIPSKPPQSPPNLILATQCGNPWLKSQNKYLF
jgi:hypothetical protein